MEAGAELEDFILFWSLLEVITGSKAVARFRARPKKKKKKGEVDRPNYRYPTPTTLRFTLALHNAHIPPSKEIIEECP